MVDDAINSFICDTTHQPDRLSKVILLKFFITIHKNYLLNFVYTGTVNFNHYHGCSRGPTVGRWDKNGHFMSFPRVDVTRRTDVSFRRRMDKDHHKVKSPLEELPINMVDDFPSADSLHLLDLGVMKKCLIGRQF